MAGQTKKGRGIKGGPSRPNYVSLDHISEMDAGGAEAMKLERLKRAWPFFVGQGNAQKTRPLSIRHGMLVIGCQDSSLLTDLRTSADEIWPSLRDKVNSALNVHLQKIDIIPCDPEPDESVPMRAAAGPSDPLDAVLKHYQRANSNKNGQGSNS